MKKTKQLLSIISVVLVCFCGLQGCKNIGSTDIVPEEHLTTLSPTACAEETSLLTETYASESTTADETSGTAVEEIIRPKTNMRLAGVTRYKDNQELMQYTFQYDPAGHISGLVEELDWNEDGVADQTAVWEYTYDNAGNLLQEHNRNHSNRPTYRYSYRNGVLDSCLIFLEGSEYRKYDIKTNWNGLVTSVVGMDPKNSGYQFKRTYTYNRFGIPVAATGSETMSFGTTNTAYSYNYYPTLMQITETSGVGGAQNPADIHFRIDNLQIASLPDFFVPDEGTFELDKNGFVANIRNKDNSLLWTFHYESKDASEQESLSLKKTEESPESMNTLVTV